MNKSEKIDLLAAAMCKVQGELKGAPKDSENPFFHSRYADLQSVWDTCRELLSKNNLCVVQTMEPGSEGKVMIVTTLLHSSGQWMDGRLEIAPSKQDPQAYGSAISYGRRYALAAAIGIYQTDDDAEGAMVRKGPEKKPETKVVEKVKEVLKEVVKAKTVVTKEDVLAAKKDIKEVTAATPAPAPVAEKANGKDEGTLPTFKSPRRKREGLKQNTDDGF